MQSTIQGSGPIYEIILPRLTNISLYDGSLDSDRCGFSARIHDNEAAPWSVTEMRPGCHCSHAFRVLGFF